MESESERLSGLLADARAGDEESFAALVGPYRSELLAHCYRMLGSLHEAEDVLQEVLVRAWRGLAAFEGRSSVRTWLYRIATNASLNAIESRSRHVESTWVGPFPDTELVLNDEVAAPAARYEQTESLELAFVAALQHLPGNQRAALILCDVLGFTPTDAAGVMETTTTSVNSALQHARRNAADRIPARSQQMTLQALGDERLQRMVERYMRAFEAVDLDALVSLLATDATWSMPPTPEWYRGREAIAAFLTAGPLTEQWRHVSTTANGQPAVGCYMWDDDRGIYVGRVLDVLTLDGDHIAAVTAFIDHSLFDRFGLPTELSG